MKIQVNLSALSETKWYEYAARFLFGGLITAIAGVMAKYFGPVVGGLFLAFPAIFPASATLIEKHEKEKKEQIRLTGTKRAADAVSADAVGAAIGSIGLAAFAGLVWQALPTHSAWLVIGGATVVWFVISILLWEGRKRL